MENGVVDVSRRGGGGGVAGLNEGTVVRAG